MAKKKGNPLRGKFRDPPQEGNASVPEQAEQDADQVKLAAEQTSMGDVPTETAEAPADPMPADAPAPEQADQGEAPAEPPEAPAAPAPADAPAPEQADQGEAPAEPSEAPADPAPADVPAPEQADQGEAPAELSEAPAGAPNPQHPDARFVKLADIAPLSGTYIKDTPRDDYTELLDSIKTNGLERPIILRDAGGGTYDALQSEIDAMTDRRRTLYNAKRAGRGGEDAAQDIAAITARLRELRRELKLCVSIERDIPLVKTAVQAAQQTKRSVIHEKADQSRPDRNPGAGSGIPAR